MSPKIKKRKKLIIVESPTKAKTISRFLGDDFIIDSCQGHIRDLPKGKMGIDIKNKFTPQYVIPIKKRKIVTKLKKLIEIAEQVYFATDEDREGEAIAWHLNFIFKNDKSSRITFDEITEKAIKEALENPRQIDENLFQSQQARRVLDRLVGYHLSPFLWKKVFKGLSAGRVQSPTLRLIVEREREIQKFKPQEYWSIEAELRADKIIFLAKLIKKDGQSLDKLEVKTEKQAQELKKNLERAEYQVLEIKNKQINKSPLPPFTTSTLQQEANKKFGFSVKQTMLIAQQLYEGIDLGEKTTTGLITYMRTDSFNLSEEFLKESANFIKIRFGEKYYQKHIYKTKSKLTQEAHEAIRPVSPKNEPDKIAAYLNKNQLKLYDLIWRRAVASQMSQEILETNSINIKATTKEKSEVYIFRTNGLLILFDGWTKIYPEKQNETHLPKLKIGQKLDLIQLKIEQHFTEPPPRFTEASLVKTLEEYGIGRPSTYAPIISTLQARNYIYKQQKAFYPSPIGILVNDILIENFPNIVDYQFTAEMENGLDNIAQGKENYFKMLNDFYQPFIRNLKMKETKINKTFEDEKTDKKCPKCQSPLVIKTGRFGKFLACTGFPKCRYTKSLNQEPNGDNNKTGVPCPKCGNEIIKKRTKKGKIFYGCSNWPNCNFALWNEPLNEKCPKCGNLMVKKGEKIFCSNKECK